jgi:hypothetical protein
MTTNRASGGLLHNRWFFPAFCLLLGGIMAGAFYLGDQDGNALFSLGLFGFIAAVFALGGRSETVRQIRGDGRDERWARIDLAGTAVSGMVIITAIIALCIYEWAHGRDGSPYVQLGALGGVSYIVAIVILMRRG